MIRKLFFSDDQQTLDKLNITTQPPSLKTEYSLQINRLLNKKRSSRYVKSLKELDSIDHTYDKKQIECIVCNIQNEFPEIKLEGMLIGIISLCYLGYPYEVHSLDLSLNIIEHFKINEPMPNGLERARNLALRGGYEFIEVYIDCCRAVSSDGSVSVVKC